MPKVTLKSIKAKKPSETPGDELYFVFAYARVRWPNGEIVESTHRVFDKGKSLYEAEEGDTLKPKLDLLDGLNPDEGAILVFTAWEHDSSEPAERKKAAKAVERVAKRAAKRMPHDLEVALNGADRSTVSLPVITDAIGKGILLAKEVIKAVAFIEDILSSPDDLIGGVQIALYRKPSGETAWSYSFGEGMAKAKQTANALKATFTGDASKYYFNFTVSDSD